MWRYCLLLLLGVAGAAVADDGGEKPAASSVPKIRPALVQAIRTNLDYCRDWAAAGDTKSLKQGLFGTYILVDTLARRTRDDHAIDLELLRVSIAWVVANAEKYDAAQIKERVEGIETFVALCEAAAARETPKAIGKNPNGFKPLMALIDGTYADGKTALATSDAAAAKSNALVLAELAEWLIAERTDDRWREHARGMQTAAREAAESTSTDEKTLRAQFRAIYTHCERCHDKR